MARQKIFTCKTSSYSQTTERKPLKPGHMLHEAQYYVVMVSAVRCNAQYSFKTTRLKTFGSHLLYTLLCVNVFYSVFMLDVLLAYFLWSVNINCFKSLWIAVTKITYLSQNNIKFTATFVMVWRGQISCGTEQKNTHSRQNEASWLDNLHKFRFRTVEHKYQH
jgi:hypothetical protein